MNKDYTKNINKFVDANDHRTDALSGYEKLLLNKSIRSANSFPHKNLFVPKNRLKKSKNF